MSQLYTMFFPPQIVYEYQVTISHLNMTISISSLSRFSIFFPITSQGFSGLCQPPNIHVKVILHLFLRNYHFYTLIYSDYCLHLGCYSHNISPISEMTNYYYYYALTYLNFRPYLGWDNHILSISLIRIILQCYIWNGFF